MNRDSKGRFVKGHHHSEEVKRKISESHKGKFPWNKGKQVDLEEYPNWGMTNKKHSKESRRRMSQVKMGERNLRYGTHHSEDTKRKISQANKGKPSWIQGLSKETDPRVGKISRKLKGKEKPPRSKEHCRKISKLAKDRCSDPEYRKIISKETKKAMRDSSIRAKISNAQKERFKDPLERARLLSHAFPLGEENPNWEGGVSFEPYTPDFNSGVKEDAKKRDGYACRECGKTEEQEQQEDALGRGLSIHHINYDKKNCDPSNLITLCRSCNAMANHNRAYWRKHFSEMVNND